MTPADVEKMLPGYRWLLRNNADERIPRKVEGRCTVERPPLYMANIQTPDFGVCRVCGDHYVGRSFVAYAPTMERALTLSFQAAATHHTSREVPS